MKNWVWWLIVGVISLVGGVFALANPFAATLTAVVLAGWLFMVVGVLVIISAFGDLGWGGRILTLLLGVLLVVLGGNLIGEPLSGMISLTYFVAVMLLVTGAFRVFLGFGSSNSQLRWVMILSGAISILLGVMIFANFPQSAAVVLGLFLGIDLISNGVWLIMLALHRKAEGDR
ncbi:HdeD family acid-resistance protein [Pseudorhodobacter sp.]|uniref:HdeD family acid-resistance protein n=1 Tax=Pseudorhodobacter sp. TaxID=1934400 RepID=UPI0026495486|nr:DUF308 domain-containing protein [Pseudorhodobacter sp.]MDN5788881.1 DUF308 domain-containing protein [Pseudorhodobacter sp.]